MLDAHRMNVFLTAAETLNFTEAARLLNMTQPSVSQHIQSLEQHFKTPLFIRSGRQLSLTDAGQALLPMARQLVRLSVRIDETMASLHGQVHGQLRLGCSTTGGAYILPSLLAQFLKKNPRVRVACRMTTRRQAEQDLCEGKVHVALAGAEEFSGRDVEIRLLFADPIGLIVPPDHSWAHRGEIEPDDLLEGDFILSEEDSAPYRLLQQGLHELGLPVGDLNCILTLGSSEAIALAVQEGLGVGFVPGSVLRRLGSRLAVAVPVCGLSLQEEVYIAQNRRHPPTRAQSAFWQFVTDPENPVLCCLVEQDVEETWPAGPVR